MIEKIDLAIPNATSETPYPALSNPAVAHCQHVWQAVYESLLKKKKAEVIASIAADKAYRQAMPPLSGYQNICDFVACVGYAMLMGYIRDERGGKLLYAAQVAMNSVPRPTKEQGRKAA